MRSMKAVQSTNKDYNKMSRNSTQGLEPCMEQIGKAISLFSKCDGYLLCYVNTFWGCSHAWDVELLLTGIQAVYQRSFTACKDTIELMCVLLHVNAWNYRVVEVLKILYIIRISS